MYDFELEQPSTGSEAVATMLAFPGARLLAGGQTLIPVLKQRLDRPSHLIDLSRSGLTGIEIGADHVTIGAMTTHREIAEHPDVARLIPGLATLASMIGDRQVRNRGTIGGSLANNDPAACYPAAVLALGATIRTTGRAIAAHDFFVGLFTTALASDELILAITFPVPVRCAYAKFRHQASRFALVGVFVAQGPAGTRVAVTGAAQQGVFRQAAMEAALEKVWSDASLDGIVVAAANLNDDMHASADYRAHLVGVMARRAVRETMATS